GGARSTASSPDAVPAQTSPAVPQTPSGTVRPRRGARTPPPDRPRSEWPSPCPSPPFPAIPRSIDRKRDVGTRWRAAVKLLPPVSLSSSPTPRRLRLPPLSTISGSGDGFACRRLGVG